MFLFSGNLQTPRRRALRSQQPSRFHRQTGFSGFPQRNSLGRIRNPRSDSLSIGLSALLPSAFYYAGGSESSFFQAQQSDW
jgi:hypothetical protein